MKLWHVEIRIPVVVVAENLHKAYKVAEDNIDMVMACEDAIAFSYAVLGTVDCVSALPCNWIVQSIPYGGDGETDIGEYLEKIVTPDTKTIDMFNESGK